MSDSDGDSEGGDAGETAQLLMAEGQGSGVKMEFKAHVQTSRGRPVRGKRTAPEAGEVQY